MLPTFLIIGAAKYRIPVIVDGFISSAAALVACRLNENIKDYLFFSHASAENGFEIFCEKFQVKPILHLDMRLGEGTGTTLGIFLAETAARVLAEMATFAEAGVSEEEKAGS